MSKRRLAIIPARAGSSGCPGKNMAELGGKPLVWHTIDQAKRSGLFTDIVVSSNWPEVLKVARDEGVLGIDRPLHLSTGTAEVKDVIRHTLQVLERSGKTYDSFVLLNPTSPLRAVEDIQGIVNLKEKHSAPCGLTLQEFKPLVVCQIRGGTRRWWHPANLPNVNRQRRKPIYVQNGAVYAVDVPYFLAKDKVVGEKCVVWIMPQERSVDIDSTWDLLTARAWYAEYQRVGAQEIDLKQPAETDPGEPPGPVAGEVLPPPLS